MISRPLLSNACFVLGLAALSACGNADPHRGRGPLKDAGQDPSPHDDASQSDDDAGDSSDAGRDAGDNHDAEPAPWYESRSPLTLSISGPFGAAFRAAFAGVPDGFIPPIRAKDPFTGNASYEVQGVSHSDELSFAVRGNSSLQECAFPKFKWAFETRVTDPAHIFFSTKKMKIGTHCGEEETVNGIIGRLRNEKATWREDLVYQLAHTVGIATLQTRPAILSYTDTSSEPAFEPGLTRKAFLLEHVDELARRLGATSLSNPVNCGEDPNVRPDATAVLRVKFFHAMVGNWDFQLGSRENACDSLVNTEVLTFPDGRILLVPADFDLSALVVGLVRNPDTNEREAIRADNAVACARSYLATNLEGETEAAVQAMTKAYRTKRAALLKTIGDSQVDAEGKAQAKLLIEGFFTALDR